MAKFWWKWRIADRSRRYLAIAVIFPAACSAVGMEAGKIVPQSGAVALDSGADAFNRSAGQDSPFSAEIAAFYRARFERPVWVEKGLLNADGRHLVEALRRSDEQGIDPLDPARLGADLSPAGLSGDQIIAHDRMLTDFFLRYAYALRIGRVPPLKAGMTWAIPGPSFDTMRLLGDLGHVPLMTLLSQQPPPQAGYAHLVSALARYRDIASRGGWQPVPDGPVLERGQTGARVSALRRRLDLEGYGPFFASEHEPFDEELTRAVKTFQWRHGLTQDGRVGRETLAALNVSAEQKAEQIKFNMERWRWMPRELPARRIEVNVAAAELELFDGGRLALSLKTIVGSHRHPTPMLRSEVHAVIVNPVWNVPASIIRNEILPRLQRDPDYLRAQGIQILDRPDDPYGLQVNWKQATGAARLRLQQQPGRLNALGQLKFDMPNPFDVYLHDTPAKALFDRPVRAFSHGCIRLQFPNRLAAYLLDDPQESFSLRFGENQPTRLELGAAVPIYLLYWTAFATDGQTVDFRKDIYGHDSKMRMALRAPGGLPPVASTGQVGCTIS